MMHLKNTILVVILESLLLFTSVASGSSISSSDGGSIRPLEIEEQHGNHLRRTSDGAIRQALHSEQFHSSQLPHSRSLRRKSMDHSISDDVNRLLEEAATNKKPDLGEGGGFYESSAGQLVLILAAVLIFLLVSFFFLYDCSTPHNVEPPPSSKEHPSSPSGDDPEQEENGCWKSDVTDTLSTDKSQEDEEQKCNSS